MLLKLRKHVLKYTRNKCFASFNISNCQSDPYNMKYTTLLYVDHVDFLAVYIVYQRNELF